MKKDKLYKDLKLYNIVMSNIWQLITIILFGILAGYLLEKYSTNEKINFMLISIIVFSFIGIINFFVSIIRQSKKLEKAERAKKLAKDENNTNNEDV